MTFTELVNEVAAQLNVVSPESLTRIGRRLNTRYRAVTSSCGINTARRGTVPIAMVMGNPYLTVPSATHVEAVRDTSTGATTTLREVPVKEIQDATLATGTIPTRYAVYSTEATEVVLKLDILPEDDHELLVDCRQTASTLSGSMTPAFSEDFHDILIHGALADEYRKMEKIQLARDSEAIYQQRLSELRLDLAKSNTRRLRQGDDAGSGTGSGGSSSGTSTPGATSYLQTGLITFQRAPSAPFAVQAGSAYVPNLIADSINGQGDLALLDTVGTAQIDAGAVTLAKLADIGPNQVIGRGSGTGAPAALDLGTALTITATTLAVNPLDGELRLALEIFGA